MTMRRNRSTWDAGRKASAPPATPGYNVEDQDHPAKNQPDPEMHKYENGDTSGWNEDPKKPPYPQGNPPSTPGYDVEDKDHPAHKEMPRVSLTAAVRRKSARCVKLAMSMLAGRRATEHQIQDQALDLMNLNDHQLTAMETRFGGGFLADKQSCGDLVPIEDEGLGLGPVDDLDALLAEDDEPEPPMEAGKFSMEDIMATLKKLSEDMQELKGGKMADQNDPKGPTLAPKPKTEDEARKPEIQAAEDPLIKEFDSYDTDKTGFLMKDEWRGSKTVFAALDTDRDGIIARVDLIKACMCGEEEVPPTEAEDGLTPEEVAMLAEMTAPEESPAPKACKAEVPVEAPIVADDESGTFSMTTDPMGLADATPGPTSADDALLAEIFGGKVAKKGEDEEEEEEPKEAKTKKAKKADGDEDEEDEGEPEDEPEEEAPGEPEEDEPKKAGKKAGKKSEDDEPEEEDEEPKESKRKASIRTASQRPQPRKPNPGIRQVGAVAKTASNEISDLSKLWESAPDVSEVFGK